MENRTMYADSSSPAKALFTSSKKPSGELLATILRLDLLIVFKIIADNKSRSLSPPLTTTYLLLRTAGEDSELMAISALHDNIGFLILDESLYVKMPNERLILPQLISNIPQMLYRHFLARADDDNVSLSPEKHISQDKIMSKSSALSM